jgi:hypothetical protein
MSTDYCALVAELIDAWDKHGGNWLPEHEDVWFAAINRARAALAVPKPPGDGEVAELCCALRDKWLSLRMDQRNRAADLLQKLSAPAPVVMPVAVSERLPEPEDCDLKLQRCWWFYPGFQESWESRSRPREGVTHWLPHHALPLPQAGEVVELVVTDEKLLAMRSWSSHGPTFDSDLVEFGRRCYDLGRQHGASLAEQPVSQPYTLDPTDGDVAETVKWLREEAEDWLFANPAGCQGVRLSRTADLLERLAVPVPELPAAQAVMDAFLKAPMQRTHIADDYHALAAALRAAADQVVPGPWRVNSCCDERERSIRGGILAIAAELRGQS